MYRLAAQQEYISCNYDRGLKLSYEEEQYESSEELLCLSCAGEFLFVCELI